MLQPESRPKVMKKLIQELVSKRHKAIIEKDTGCKYMFENGKAKDLELMYKCFSKETECLVPVIHCMDTYIEDRGLKVVRDERMLNDAE
jgi:hypothetical protein